MSSECPDVTQVNLSLKGTEVGERQWELPPWHTHWGRLVYPLFVSVERRLFPLGTAFGFSMLSHVLTARHNVEEGLKSHHPNANQFARKGLEGARNKGDLQHTHFVVLSQGPNPKRGDVSLDLRSLSSIHATPPTDLLIGNMLNSEASALVPSIHPVISFAPPRIGETVFCIGYPEMEVPEGGLCVDGLRDGRLNPYEAYKHRLLVVEGRVNNIFTQRFANGFLAGPCFTIDNEVPAGLSGGPILRTDGVICGVVSAAASMFFDSPTAIGSLFYPLFLLRLSFGMTMAGGRFRFTATERPVAELVATQAIRTDGAEEEQLHFTPEASGVRVGAAFHKDDSAFIFEDFPAYQRGEPMQSLSGPLRGFRPNPEHPLVKKRRGI